MKLELSVLFEVGQEKPAQSELTVKRNLVLTDYDELRTILRLIDIVLKHKGKNP